MIQDLYNYKEAYKIYKLLLNKDHTNIFIYGDRNIDKTKFIKEILTDFFKIKNKNTIVNESINYEYNDYYYYFNVKGVKYDIKNSFINTIKPIVSSFNYYTGLSNYVIFDNFDYINPIIENQLKVIIEKSSTTSKFILITSNFTKHLEAIKSRCINIRLPSLNIYDKEIIIKDFMKSKKISCDIDKYLYQYDIETIKKKLLVNYKDPYDIFLDKIILLMVSKLSKNITEIKDLSYNFKNSVLDINILLKRIINYYLQQKINSKKKIKIVQTISEFNYLMVNCYKDIIYIEYLLIDLYNILNE